MNINFTFDQSDDQLPAGFKAVVNSVAQFFQAQFSDPITLNISVGYGEIHGQPVRGGLGQSSIALQWSTYAQERNALAADAKSADDFSSVASLPSADPTPFGTMHFVSQAEAKALALPFASSNASDGAIGINAGPAFDFDRSNGISPGTYDLFSVVAHELSVVMGRNFSDGAVLPFDLFHFTGAGARIFSGNQPGYFSVDGGVTHLADFNTAPGGDPSDWADSAGNDAFRAFGPSGTLLQVTEADLKALDVIGYDRVAAPVTPITPAPPPPPPPIAVPPPAPPAPPDPHIINGDGGDNVLTGTAANDHIFGLDGNDRLLGLGGADMLDGGAGNDTVSYADSPAAIDVRLDTGFTAGGDAQGDAFVSIENVTGSAFNDTLIGDTGPNILMAGAGDDQIYGHLANDDLYGGAGNDHLYGQAGWDNLYGGDGNDVIDGGTEGDVIRGEAGDDTLIGGAGGDLLDGGAGSDTASYASSPVAVNIWLNSYFAYGGDADGDRLFAIENLTGSDFNDTLISNDADNRIDGGAGNDSIWALNGNDTLLGGAGNDIIHGQNGNDIIAGGVGNDTLWGEANNDLFVFHVGDGQDRIVDFSPAGAAQDQIQFAGYPGISSFSSLLSVAHDHSDFMTFDFVNGDSLRLDNLHIADLTASDFLFG